MRPLPIDIIFIYYPINIFDILQEFKAQDFESEPLSMVELHPHD